jgi:hypothetical protein
MDATIKKNYISIIAIALFVVSAVVAGNDEEFFLRGNKYYKNKDYDNALTVYTMMAAKGRAVLYNMGNCYFHKGDYPQALVYWSRAEHGATAQEYQHIKRNKEHVLQLMGKQTAPSWWQSSVQDIAQGISLLLLQLLFLVCWFMLIFLLHKKDIKMKKMMVTTLCLLMSLSGALLTVHYNKHGVQDGIVVKKEAQLFAGPQKGFQVVAQLCCADNVAVKEVRQGWYKVQHAGMIGWVEADGIQII